MSLDSTSQHSGRDGHFAQLVASLDAVVWEADPRTLRMTFVSSLAERLLGHPSERWLEPGFWIAHIHPEDREAALAICRRATSERRVLDFECRMLAADAREVWVRNVVTVAFEGDAPTVMRGVMLDITAQRRDAEARQQDIRLLAALDRINRAIQGAHDLSAMMRDVLGLAIEIFACDRAWLGAPCNPEAAVWRCEMERTRSAYPGALELGVDIPVDGEVIQVFRAARDSAGSVDFGPGGAEPLPRRLAERFSIQSMLAMALQPAMAEPFAFGLHQCSHARVWTAWEKRLFEEIGRRLTDALSSLHLYRRVQRSEARLSAAQRVAHVGHWEWDRATGAVEWSDETCRILGLEPGCPPLAMNELLPRLHAEDLPLLREALRRAEAVGGSFDAEFRIVRPGGEVRTVHCQGTVANPGSGPAAQCSFGTLQDVTERKRAEAALRQSHDLLRAVVDSTPDAVFVKDTHGRYLLVNAAGLSLLAQPLAEVVGRTDLELFGADAAMRAMRERELEVMASGREQRGERIVGEGMAARFHHATIGAYRDGRGQVIGIVGIVRDVTEQRHVEEQFREAQKMEAVGRLAGGLAHDFNNLLTVVNGCSELLALGLEAGDPLRRLVDEIHNAGNRAGRLTRQLLAFGRKQMLQPQTIDLGRQLDDLQTLLTRLLGEQIELVRESAPDVGMARVDPGQFEQAIVNLVVNARDAMPDGGRLTISLRNVAVTGELDLDPELRPGSYVAVCVTDSGSGIDAATKARIFEPFFTTKEAGKGTGLGLAMVYGFVKQSGGHVAVESEPGRGTAFNVYLPRADGPVELPPPPALQLHGPRGSETLLLVEDDESVRNLLGAALRERGYVVLEAIDGEDGLRVWSHQGGRIDLLVTDLVMPRLGGRRLAEKLRVVEPTLPVLLLSGYADEIVSEAGPGGRGFAFLHKPFTPVQIARKIRELLDRAAASRVRDRGESIEENQ